MQREGAIGHDETSREETEDCEGAIGHDGTTQEEEEDEAQSGEAGRVHER